MSVATARRMAPGIKQLLPLPYGHLGRSRRDPLGFLLDARKVHGDVFRYRVGPLVFHQVARPEHVQHVLLDRQKNYPRSWYYKRTSVVAGKGLVTTEGAEWRRLRRMSQPAFHHKRVMALAGAMTDATDAMRRRWAEHARGGEPLDVAEEFVALTLRIVGRTLLGIDLGGEADRIGPAVTTMLDFGEHWINNLLALPPGVPTPRNRRFQEAKRTIDSVIFEIIARRRRVPEAEANDLLALLMAARDEETGEGLTDAELRDQILTFVVAGHETTAVALAWTVHLLSQHQEADERLRAEVASALDGRVPNAEDLPRLPFTRQVIEESMRLYPPIFGLLRDAAEADEIGGYHIPAKSTIILSPYVTHHHPDVWPDPERFDPDRFLPERVAARPRFAWYPFLGGPHQCIGQEFAMMEATLILAMLAQAFRLELAPGARVEPRARLSLRPKDGVPMIVRRA